VTESKWRCKSLKLHMQVTWPAWAAFAVTIDTTVLLLIALK
jgi:hypothetical protein